MNGTDTIGRFGYVSASDPQRHMARVEFPDLGIVSGWLPVLVRNSRKNHDEALPDIGEHVYCLLHENTGIILGAVYDDKNTPLKADQDFRRVIFDDGTEIYYDRKSHIMEITDCNGNSIKLSGRGIEITSCGVIDYNASGNITGSAGSSMKLAAGRIDLN